MPALLRHYDSFNASGNKSKNSVVCFFLAWQLLKNTLSVPLLGNECCYERHYILTLTIWQLMLTHQEQLTDWMS